MNAPEEDPAAQRPGDEAEERTVEIPAQEKRYLQLEEERDQLAHKLERTLADLANVRRRQRTELDDARRRALEGFAQELLPVLDNFRTALRVYDEKGGGDVRALVEGVRLVHTLLAGALERHGLQEIAAEGQPFDPARHEAVALEEASGTPAGVVLRVLQPGYALGDRVVRHAKVVVSGTPRTDADAKP